MATKKSNRKKKAAKAKSKRSAPKKPARPKKSTRGRSGGGATTNPGPRARIHQGVGLNKLPKSPDTEGLSAVEDVDSESVAELVDEGQAFEAEVVDAVENAPDADQGEIRTKEVPENDVPPEYRDYRETDD
jgi:hypothetical protein